MSNWLPWVVAGLALVLAAWALLSARRTARRLAELTTMYWQLKFDHGELKARLDPPPPADPAPPKPTFVPLASIKRS